MSNHINEIIEGSRAAFKEGWLLDILKQPGIPFDTLAVLVDLINLSRASYGLEPLPSIEREDGAHAIPVELLYILPDHPSFRVIDEQHEQHIERILRSYMFNPLAVSPVTVKPMLIDGNLRLAVLDGYIRYIAMIMAKEQGAKIDFVLARARI